jgi:hypothetical protein
MPFHFCGDELLAVLAAVPFARVCYVRLCCWVRR